MRGVLGVHRCERVIRRAAVRARHVHGLHLPARDNHRRKKNMSHMSGWALSRGDQRWVDLWHFMLCTPWFITYRRVTSAVPDAGGSNIGWVLRSMVQQYQWAKEARARFYSSNLDDWYLWERKRERRGSIKWVRAAAEITVMAHRITVNSR